MGEWVLGFWKSLDEWLLGPKIIPVETNDGADLIICENTLVQVKKERDNFAKQITTYDAQVSTLTAQVAELQSEVASGSQTESEKEKYWNSKYPKDDTVTYECRYIFLHDGTRKNCLVDPRIFYQPYGGQLTALAGNLTKNCVTNDDKAEAILSWVQDNIQYKSDIVVEGIDEYWQFWYETLQLKSGDCEDGAILIANLMLAAGIPYWRIRLNAGAVFGGNHCYVTYCRETDNEFVVMDWCYEEKKIPVSQRKLHRDERDYWAIWWSFNTRYVFKKVLF